MKNFSLIIALFVEKNLKVGRAIKESIALENVMIKAQQEEQGPKIEEKKNVHFARMILSDQRGTIKIQKCFSVLKAAAVIGWPNMAPMVKIIQVGSAVIDSQHIPMDGIGRDAMPLKGQAIGVKNVAIPIDLLMFTI